MAQLKIAVCNRKTDTIFKNQEWSWEDIVKRNRSPIRTSETVLEYPKLPKAKRDALKDVGGFVGGQLKGGIRKNGQFRPSCAGRRQWPDASAGQRLSDAFHIRPLPCRFQPGCRRETA